MVMVRYAGGARQDDPRGQPGRRGAVPPGHRAPPGERRGLLTASTDLYRPLLTSTALPSISSNILLISLTYIVKRDNFN